MENTLGNALDPPLQCLALVYPIHHISGLKPQFFYTGGPRRGFFFSLSPSEFSLLYFCLVVFMVLMVLHTHVLAPHITRMSTG